MDGGGSGSGSLAWRGKWRAHATWEGGLTLQHSCVGGSENEDCILSLRVQGERYLPVGPYAIFPCTAIHAASPPPMTALLISQSSHF